MGTEANDHLSNIGDQSHDAWLTTRIFVRVKHRRNDRWNCVFESPHDESVLLRSESPVGMSRNFRWKRLFSAVNCFSLEILRRRAFDSWREVGGFIMIHSSLLIQNEKISKFSTLFCSLLGFFQYRDRLYKWRKKTKFRGHFQYSTDSMSALLTIIVWCDVTFENGNSYQPMKDEYKEKTNGTLKKTGDSVDMVIFNQGK